MGHGSNPKTSKNNNAASPVAGSKYRTVGGANLNPDPVDWADVDPAAICDAVAAVVAAGDAITFSRTRDGGAYSVTVLADGQRHFSREHHAEDIAERLREVAADARSYVKFTS